LVSLIGFFSFLKVSKKEKQSISEIEF
jgi:hypothetical protein